MADPSRYVLHLPFTAPDTAESRQYARMLARSMGRLPEVDAAGATVSDEDNQGVHSQIFRDRPLGGGGRCVLRADHEVPCAVGGVGR
ncbi:hypothetical protein [Plantactinospora sp. CA-290183]|uniref:hypothetical protein n=1 Tax=Plantactinospora sp. CA-290183 TaxID=3240006 RepID=UPI003D9217CF